MWTSSIPASVICAAWNFLSPEHRSNSPFDVPVILFDDIAEVFALANLDAFIVIFTVGLDGGLDGITFVDIDEPGFAISINGFVQKSQCRFLIALGREYEVDGIALLVDGPIEVLPLAIDFDIGFVEASSLPRPLLPLVERLFKLRREMDDPPQNGAVIDCRAALRHDRLDIAIAHRISQIPLEALKDHFLLEMPSLGADHGLSGKACIRLQTIR